MVEEQRGARSEGREARSEKQEASSVRTITVQVLLFAQLRERLGGSGVSVTLPAQATGRSLLQVLGQRDPAVRPLLEASRLAVGQEYVSWDHPLREGDEAAILPPVSGG